MLDILILIHHHRGDGGAVDRGAGHPLYHRRWIVLAPWLFRVRSEALLLGVLAHEVGHCYAGADDDAAEAWAASHLPTLWHRYQAAYGALKR